MYYSLICSATLITVIISEYSLFFSAILIKKKVLWESLKDNAHFTDRYGYNYNTEISEISLISI